MVSELRIRQRRHHQESWAPSPWGATNHWILRDRALWPLHPEKPHVEVQGQIWSWWTRRQPPPPGHAILEELQGWFFHRMVQGLLRALDWRGLASLLQRRPKSLAWEQEVNWFVQVKLLRPPQTTQRFQGGHSKEQESESLSCPLFPGMTPSRSHRPHSASSTSAAQSCQPEGTCLLQQLVLSRSKDPETPESATKHVAHV